jgi:ABC-type phosphate transport system substrate-binding protein
MQSPLTLADTPSKDVLPAITSSLCATSRRPLASAPETESTDFAASDTSYRDGSDKFSNLGPEQTNVGYSYVPDVGGAVAFPYHLNVRGHPITNLRLSDETIFRIFTGQIRNWDNPAITHDYGSQLPSTPIVPVIHAGSAGSTYYFTNWLAHVYPRQWNAFCDSVASWIRPPCGPTEFYPQVGNAQGADSSTAVVNDVMATNGAIGYDEYDYAFAAQVPVTYLRNPAGRYVLPLAANVTTALSRAVVNGDHSSPDFLQEDLDGVYTDKNPASYPVSYYGYLIVPRSGTTLPRGFTTAEGLALSEFVYYALCSGQQHVAPIGYAPLPGKLIRNGLKQVRRIPGHFAMPALSECHDLPH